MELRFIADAVRIKQTPKCGDNHTSARSKSSFVERILVKATETTSAFRVLLRKRRVEEIIMEDLHRYPRRTIVGTPADILAENLHDALEEGIVRLGGGTAWGNHNILIIQLQVIAPRRVDLRRAEADE